MAMKLNKALTSLIIGTSCLVFAGCQPVPTPEETPTTSPTSTIPSTVPETLQVQADICGKLPSAIVSEVTGVRVAAPSVTTIESTTGAKRHVCAYAREGNPAEVVAYVNVSFRKESTSEAYQLLWDNQKTSQAQTATPVPNLGTEAYLGQVDNQPTLYVLFPDAQYWIRMGQTTQSPERQAQIVQGLAEAVTGQ